MRTPKRRQAVIIWLSVHPSLLFFRSKAIALSLLGVLILISGIHTFLIKIFLSGHVFLIILVGPTLFSLVCVFIRYKNILFKRVNPKRVGPNLFIKKFRVCAFLGPIFLTKPKRVNSFEQKKSKRGTQIISVYQVKMKFLKKACQLCISFFFKS